MANILAFQPRGHEKSCAVSVLVSLLLCAIPIIFANFGNVLQRLPPFILEDIQIGVSPLYSRALVFMVALVASTIIWAYQLKQRVVCFSLLGISVVCAGLGFLTDSVILPIFVGSDELKKTAVRVLMFPFLSIFGLSLAQTCCHRYPYRLIQ